VKYLLQYWPTQQLIECRPEDLNIFNVFQKKINPFRLPLPKSRPCYNKLLTQNRILLTVKPIYKIIILFILLADLSFSYTQYLQFFVDGDLPGIVSPSEGYTHVLSDPLAISVLTEGESYPATNRYFAHSVMMQYFKQVPLQLQSFLSPIDSVYHAMAIMKLLIHIALLILMAMYISGTTKLTDKKFLLSALLIFPIFQTYSYYGVIGIIDHCITYAIFYALAICYVLLMFLPFYLSFTKKQKLPISSVIFSSVICLIAVLNGPLNSGVIPIVAFLIIMQLWLPELKVSTAKSTVSRFYQSFKKIPAVYLIAAFIFISLCIYSLYIGKYNSENNWATIPIWERYKRLPIGIGKTMATKIGPMLLVISSVINIALLRKDQATFSKLKNILIWVSIFAVIYLLLLPLGGYRDYRPNIVRRDTFLPVTLCIMYVYGYSSLQVILSLQKRKIPYYIYIGLISLIFVNADAKVKNENNCEKESLYEIASSKADTVRLTNSCNVMSWGKIPQAEYSNNSAKLLQHWNITEKKKYFYHPNE